MNSNVNRMKKQVCDRWEIFSAFSIELSYTDKYKCHVIETDSDLQSLAAYFWAKKRPTVNICMSLTDVSQSVSVTDNELSSRILSCVDDQNGESLAVLKHSTWRRLFKEVGQIFKSEAVEFREKLLLYSLETGYIYKFVQNEKSRLLLNTFTKKKMVAIGGFMLLKS